MKDDPDFMTRINQELAARKAAYRILDVPEDDTYRLDNAWGHFCWWRAKFFEP